jgi:hypothetical protein
MTEAWDNASALFWGLAAVAALVISLNWLLNGGKP